jgi:hypothetical protein
MDSRESLQCTKCECKCHIVFIPKWVYDKIVAVQAAACQYRSHWSLAHRLTSVATGVTLARFHRIPGPLRRWPSCLQKLSIGPLEIG